MKTHDKVSSIFWFSFGSFITIYSLCTLDIGVLKEPGPGFFLLISGIGLCLMAVLIFIHATLSKETESIHLFSGVIWYKPVIVLLIIFLYIYFLRKLGFILDTLLLMIVLFKSVEPQSWRMAILYSFLSVLITWFIFAFWLDVQLPAGLLSAPG